MTYAAEDKALSGDGVLTAGLAVDGRATGGLAAAGMAGAGMAGALLASSCCIAPLVLVTLGVSGAWIGALSAMAPYQPLFAASARGDRCGVLARLSRAPPCHLRGRLLRATAGAPDHADRALGGDGAGAGRRHRKFLGAMVLLRRPRR